jgi:hypothetical protein
MQQQPPLMQQQPPPMQQQPPPMQQQPPLMQQQPSISSTTHSSMSSSSQTSSQRERDAKRVKEQFLMFTRVLMKYLEQKDPEMHMRAKQVIRECAERNKNKEHGYESVTASMKTRLRETVGEQYWKRADSYLIHFQEMQQKKKLQEAQKSQGQPQVPPSQPQNTLQQHHQQQQQQQHAAKQAVLQKQLAKQQEEKEKERLAREKLEEMERQKKLLQQKQEELRKQQQQEKLRNQHAAKVQQIREATSQKIAAIKAQASLQRAEAATIQRPPGTAVATLTAITTGVPATKMTESQTSSSSSTAQKRKTSATGSTASSSASASRTPSQAVSVTTPTADADLGPPREYSEFMEMIDHAVNYDYTTAGILLANKSYVDLSTEQRKLLYGSAASQPKIPPNDHTIRRGWGERNIVTARAAWAKVRLPQLERELKESKSAGPVVAGISLPSTKTDSTKIRTSWFNEDRAEQDKTLAVLSEATQIYVKQLLDKALHCARQRENLDGIRLWHMQHSGAKPPLSLRLGCDVSRQVALADGNAALTVQRMEEALERNPAPRADLKDPDVLAEASSMGDLACRPKLATAAEKANYSAKRSFEVSGGKDAANAPPFGRVPKQAKIMAHDFELSLELSSRLPPRTPTFHFV